MKKTRLTYALIFVVLLITEVLIALYVHDAFIRPYIGDVLVTVLLCCLCKTLIPKGIACIPIYVFVFSVFVEFTQYLNLVKLLGLDHSKFFSTIMGSTFSIVDILCYGVGCLVFWAAEKSIISFSNRKKT